ncbi:MAG TPA: diguanylate cyclase response regulator [Nitrospiraceae bacterium]|nr:diguanylate cyclase response regulator [Nitrospiraceae bacterium]
MIRVLLVEENEAEARDACSMLQQAGEGQMEVIRVAKLSAALRRLSSETFDVILLDGALVDTHGLTTLDLVQAALASMPLVLLSNQDDPALERKAIQQGVQDVIVKKNWTREHLIRSVHHAVDRKRAEKSLAYLAQYDPLTALANRALFRDRLTHALALAKRKKQEVGVVLLGLDRFKNMIEQLGSEIGDALLSVTADRLKQCMRDVDTVARLSGNEFTCLLEGITCKNDMEIVARRILASMDKPVQMQDQTVGISASLGLAVFPLDGQEADGLLDCAKQAMVCAQEAGGAGYQLYTVS